MGLNLKKIRAYKIIITTLLVITFTVSMISCKEAPAVVEQQQQEEEKPAVEVPSETVPEENKEETPPVVEETPEKIEWEGMIITPIEGLRFDKGTLYAEAGNPYNLEVGEKAGVLIPKDAVEINGVMESSIGLRPEVIEVMQKKIMEEKDVEMLEDLILAAVNKALLKAQQLAKERMGRLTGGLNIPGMDIPGMLG